MTYGLGCSHVISVCQGEVSLMLARNLVLYDAPFRFRKTARFHCTMRIAGQ